MALVSLMFLIYFIHHMALTMQAPYVIGEVAHDLLHAIERLFPEEVGTGAPQDRDRPNEEDMPENFDEEAKAVKGERNGYIQAIDEEALMETATENDLIIKSLYRPGHFLIEGGVLICVWPGHRLNDELADKLKGTFIFGRQRTLTQDVEFGIEQLVEVAERSLSQGINATFTAVACIDWLAAALAKLSKKGFPSPYRYDSQGSLRIVFARPLTLEGVIDTAFNQIRQSARDNVAVHIRLLENIRVLRKMTDDPQAVEALERHAKMIERDSASHRPQREDQKNVQERSREVMNSDNTRREP
jgi:uncharacterized membrane protein